MGGILMFSWLTYDTQTGSLGKHAQTGSPMIQTTTVTVGTDAPKVNTTSTTTLTASTTTTYANTAQVTLEGIVGATITNYVIKDASGDRWTIPNVTIGENGTTTATATCEVTNAAASVTTAEVWTVVTPNANVAGMTNEASVTTETVVTIVFDPNLIHLNQAIIGAFDGVTVVMTSAEQDAYNNTQAWLYQGGAFVANPNWPAMQLAQAQQAQIAAIEAGYQATLNGGFTSSADGMALTYGFASADQTNLAQEATMMLAGATVWPIEWATYGGAATVSLTQAQFTQLLTDGQSFKWACVKQLRTLTAQVQAATTVSDAQAVVWTTPTY